jgi:bifunctional DNA-binding transcriptional regulator/antitoxin component of YhaV-PrlF toxin-antitoxin module
MAQVLDRERILVEVHMSSHKQAAGNSPKSIAERFNIKPRDQIEWEAGGETIRVIPARRRTESTILHRDRLKHFDQQRNDSGTGKKLSNVRCSLLLL